MASPPAAGTYVYDTDGGADGFIVGVNRRWRYEDTSTLVVEPLDERLQRSVRDVSDRNGNGLVTETGVEFKADGVHLTHLYVTTTFDAVTDQREFRPDASAIIQPTGQQPGDVVRFTMSGTGTSAAVTIEALRQEHMEIGGRSVESMFVRIETMFTGEVEGQSIADTWYLAEHQLILREHVVTDVSAGMDRLRSEYTATLTDLEPVR